MDVGGGGGKIYAALALRPPRFAVLPASVCSVADYMFCHYGVHMS
jgi:hypothetical protein